MLTRRGFLHGVVAAPLGLSVVEARLRAAPPTTLPLLGSIVQEARDLDASKLIDLQLDSELAWDERLASPSHCRTSFTAELIATPAPRVGEHVRISVPHTDVGFTGVVMRVEQQFGHHPARVSARISGLVIEQNPS